MRNMNDTFRNLLEILAASTGRTPEECAAGYTQYGPLKTDTGEAVVALLEPIQARYRELMDDRGELAARRRPVEPAHAHVDRMDLPASHHAHQRVTGLLELQRALDHPIPPRYVETAASGFTFLGLPLYQDRYADPRVRQALSLG